MLLGIPLVSNLDIVILWTVFTFEINFSTNSLAWSFFVNERTWWCRICFGHEISTNIIDESINDFEINYIKEKRWRFSFIYSGQFFCHFQNQFLTFCEWLIHFLNSPIFSVSINCEVSIVVLTFAYLRVHWVEIHPDSRTQQFTLIHMNSLPGRNLGHQFQDSKYNRRIGDDHLWYTTSSGHLIQVEIQLHDEHHNQQRDSMRLQKQEPNEHWMQDEFFQYSIKSFQNTWRGQ